MNACFTLAIIIGAGIAQAAGLPPGQHTSVAKYWPAIRRHVTNFTPFEFDYALGNLTPDRHGGLWFSAGLSIEHIDARGNISQFRMPSRSWRVSGITLAGSQVWFTIGQSGKVGIIDARGHLTLKQVVPRRNFPDLRDLIVNKFNEMWFLDPGRASIGYRSTSGRVVEHPLPNKGFPWRLVHCVGKLWVLADYSQPGVALGVIGRDFRVHWHYLKLPGTGISDIACDAEDRLWISYISNRPRYYHLARLDARGNIRMFPRTTGAFGMGAITSDGTGGIWLNTVQYDPKSRLTLTHIDRNDRIAMYALPVEGYYQAPIAVAPDGTLWLGISAGNAALAITRLN